MTKNIIADLSMDFSIEIVTMCDGIKGKSSIVNQLLRSGTSIGANVHEANYASSRADFIAKMQIALKECHETWAAIKLADYYGVTLDYLVGRESKQRNL